MKDISVVVIVRNEALRIKNCLLSLVRQRGIENNEIIVVDGNSSDRTINIVNDFIETYNFIKLIQCSSYGYGYQRNIGAAAADGRYVLYISGDTVVAPNLIWRYSASLKDDYDIIQGTVINVSNEKNYSGRIAKIYPIFYSSYLKTNYELFSTINVLIKRDLLIAQPFNEKLYALEDKEWIFHLDNSINFTRLKNAVVFHITHETVYEYCKKINKEASSLGEIAASININKLNTINIFNWINWGKYYFSLFLFVISVICVLLFFKLQIWFYILTIALFLLSPFCFLLQYFKKTNFRIIDMFIIYFFFFSVILGLIPNYFWGKTLRFWRKIKVETK